MEKFFTALVTVFLLWTSNAPMIYSNSMAAIDYDNVDIINIYYFGWNTQTRSRLQADDVRRYPIVEIVIKRIGVGYFLDWWNSLELTEGEFAATPDVRLVIDVRLKNGRVITLIADRFRIYDIENQKAWKINDEFRNKFGFEG
jgi:hypothetical protein